MSALLGFGLNAAAGAFSGLAAQNNQMYQWQQMFNYQQSDQKFMMNMLQSKQNFQKEMALQNAQMRGINVPSSIMNRNTNFVREQMPDNDPNDSDRAVVDNREFPAMGPPETQSVSGRSHASDYADTEASSNVDTSSLDSASFRSASSNPMQDALSTDEMHSIDSTDYDSVIPEAPSTRPSVSSESPSTDSDYSDAQGPLAFTQHPVKRAFKMPNPGYNSSPPTNTSGVSTTATPDFIASRTFRPSSAASPAAGSGTQNPI